MNTPLEDLFHQYYSPLCNYAARIIGNTDDAEDLVQSLFVGFYQNNRLLSVELTEAYLLKSVKYRCIDFLRKQKQSTPLDQTPSPLILPNEISEAEIEPLFYYYAAKLPPKTREVFLLSRVSKLTYNEIAEQLNISPKTVDNQMNSALKKLKIILKKEHYFLLSL